MKEGANLKYIAAGMLYRSYIITPKKRAYSDQPGGHSLYSAAGISVWDKTAGILSKVGVDYPKEWLELMSSHGLDVRGVQFDEEAVDLRTFHAYDNDGSIESENTLGLYAKLELPFPKSLLGYVSPAHSDEQKRRLSSFQLKIRSIPAEYYDVSAVHICPLTYDTQKSLVSLLNNQNISTITIDAGEYIASQFWAELPALFTSATAFHISEKKISDLFFRRTNDLWEMAEGLAELGCDIIVIKRGKDGQLLYDNHSKERWVIPAYPVTILDPTGAGSAFCGGFLAGYRNTYDPLSSVLHGNISASFCVEGADPFYCMGIMPGLPNARLNALKQMVKKV